MKKLFTLLFTLTIICVGVNAQKGDFILGGNLGFNYSGADIYDGKKDGLRTINFNAGPMLLYGLTDRIYLGGEAFVNLNYSKEYASGEVEYSDYKNIFGLGPVLRCYAYRGKMIAVFCDTKVGAYLGEDKAKTKYFGIIGGISPGVEFFMGQNWSLSASLSNLFSINYESANPKGPDNTVHSMDVDVQISPVSIDYAPLVLTVSYHFK